MSTFTSSVQKLRVVGGLASISLGSSVLLVAAAFLVHGVCLKIALALIATFFFYVGMKYLDAYQCSRGLKVEVSGIGVRITHRNKETSMLWHEIDDDSGCCIGSELLYLDHVYMRSNSRLIEFYPALIEDGHQLISVLVSKRKVWEMKTPIMR